MFIVKLTFNYEWPLFRQTPNYSGIWGNYKFIIDPNLTECDYWVIYSEYKLLEETCNCSKENIFFLPAEGYNTSLRYPPKFLEQFGKVITVQRELQFDNVIYHQNANPWFVEKSYDELLNLEMPPKTKLLSIISSDKAFTEGHRNRIDFAKKIKQHFGDSVDLFGRGINTFEKKWDVLSNYKYHIAIENDFCDDWVTEKFVDPILSFTYPFYYGCPNIDKYISNNSFSRIDINDFEKSVRIIEKVIKDDSVYDNFVSDAPFFRKVLLNELQLFPMLVNLFQKYDAQKTAKRRISVFGVEKYAQSKGRGILKRLINKLSVK